MAKNKSQYDSTLNLPKTLFEMRAGLPKKEPVMLKDWDDNDLYPLPDLHRPRRPPLRCGDEDLPSHPYRRRSKQVYWR